MRLPVASIAIALSTTLKSGVHFDDSVRGRPNDKVSTKVRLEHASIKACYESFVYPHSPHS